MARLSRLLVSVLILALAAIQPQAKKVDPRRIFSTEKLARTLSGTDWVNMTLNLGLPGDNELWRGIIRDCGADVSTGCLQKNVFDYLDRVLMDRADNLTVLPGLTLTRNREVCYEDCGAKDPKLRTNAIPEDGTPRPESKEEKPEDDEDADDGGIIGGFVDIARALRKKSLKFLATRNYELALPEFLADGASLRISPKEIDSEGALVRIDFGHRALQTQGESRLFGLLKKHIKSKILMGVLAALLIIKLVKVKFMFIIPFLFGVGAAKKLFLKLLLFFIPAFAHVFKLCSSYYSSHSKFQHLHHHHQIAHHHHHVPVPVPVHVSKPWHHGHEVAPPSPTFVSSIGPHGPGHHSGPPEDFHGYDYAHPHIQYRKDMEELREWGIEPDDEPYEDIAPSGSGPMHPGMPPPVKISNKFYGPYGYGAYPYHQYAANAKPIGPSGFLDKNGKLQTGYGNVNPQSLAYSGYGPLPPAAHNRQSSKASILSPGPGLQLGEVQKPSGFVKPPEVNGIKNQKLGGSNVGSQSVVKPGIGNTQQQQVIQKQTTGQHQINSVGAGSIQSGPASGTTGKPYDDEFYGPILERLDQIFGQLRFLDENCRERLVCSMYKNPVLYAPHSNLVSNELSRDPQELPKQATTSTSAERFQRYLEAARLGQDGGDCLRTFHCHINTEMKKKKK